MEPNQDPNNQVPVTPPSDDTPAWAQKLIDQTADFNNRLSAFEETVKPQEPTEPVVPQHEEPWTPQSWSDVDARAEEKAKAIVEQTLAEKEQAVQTAAQQQEAAAKEIDEMLDSQVNELTSSNKLPAIVDENDPNDPGKLAQRELYGFALSMGTADLKSSFNVLDNLHKAGKQFDFVKMEIVDKNPASAGANTPVGSSSAGTTGTASNTDYKTIHNLSLDQLASKFMQ